MTESEKLENAIAILEAMKKQFLGETRNVIDVAINALEKQIPKQITRSISKEEENRAYYYCPICCEWLTRMTNYCPNCGQKLDWSE